MRNRTGIEDWILEKANYRYESTGQKFIFPYDLGTWENIKQVADPSCAPIGNGIHWKVRSGCNQYTLTVNIYRDFKCERNCHWFFLGSTHLNTSIVLD